MEQEEISENEKRIRAITSIYYSKPDVQKVILDFSAKREVVPRYFEAFGKRPDTLVYPSDILSLVKKGATSFHASEEIWRDPLQLSTENKELSELREAWDLLIDIDSPYLDYSKIAAKLVCSLLERYGVKNYGIKFSGSKGFHIIVPAQAFPRQFEGKETRLMFPELPRAITEFILHEIKSPYNKEITKLGINIEALQEKTKLSKEELLEIPCPRCGSPSKKVVMSVFQCPDCKTINERPNVKITNRKLKCTECPGYFSFVEQKEYFKCYKCGLTSQDKEYNTEKKVIYEKAHDKEHSSDFKEEIAASKLGSLDLVLVSPRHLFRMPYSLHEKTSLSSVVITKEQLENFSPKDADPLKIKILPFYKQAREGEATHLLKAALEWKNKTTAEKEQRNIAYEKTEFKDIDFSGITEDMFPAPIKKLLNGLQEGKKRGLFVLITFLRSLNFPPEYITNKVHGWNKLNKPPLKEGYVKSQIDWHLKQKRKILPPNYSNDNFYKDLNLLDKEPNAKNPISEVIRKLKSKNGR